MALLVRDARPEDAAQVAAVHVGAWLAAYRGLMPDEFLDAIAEEEWRDRWTTRLGGDLRPPVRVALENDVVIGFYVVAAPSRDTDTTDDVAEIAALNVRPDKWRSGAGRALIHDALDLLREDDWATVTLWVANGNERAVKFYEALGFKFDGTTTTDAASGVQEVRMRLGLADINT